ncbi:YihY/virulence factor BrkB family protein [Nostocoides jenkinsii]|uniref:YihY/virulence factor BrkB family protein n=1 Tax=Nostocoides jenkinsii TaxID=330834 RepID=UPI00065B6288|nr:YhjD/YihY/BrkB family envelope integrity protein [Tetrasphaera jenkinsii]
MRDRVEQLRRRSPLVDHLWCATRHYLDAQGSLLAAAVTYYAFLSLFPLCALAFAAVGTFARVFPEARNDLARTLESMLPGVIGPGAHQLSLATLESTAATAAGFGLVAVLYAGVSWMSDLRSGLTTVFGADGTKQPNVVIAYLQNLVSLLAIGAVLLVGLIASGLLAAVTRHAPDTNAFVRLVLDGASVASGTAMGTLFFFVLFRRFAPPNLAHRALVSGALLGAVLFEILKQLSGRLLASTTTQPAFQSFGISLILLVWIYYFSRICMYAAAWAATASSPATAPATTGAPT